MKFNDATYYVMNGNTLGYIFDEQPGVLGVLASKPQLGADLSEEPKTITSSDKLKPATLKDFEFFRVQPPKM
jgi:precorrin-3B methylase